MRPDSKHAYQVEAGETAEPEGPDCPNRRSGEYRVGLEIIQRVRDGWSFLRWKLFPVLPLREHEWHEWLIHAHGRACDRGVPYCVLTLRPIGPNPVPDWRLDRLIRTCMRRTDPVGRRSRGPTLLLLPATTERGGAAAARRLVRRGRASGIELEVLLQFPDFAAAEPERLDLPGERRRGFRLWRARRIARGIALPGSRTLDGLCSRFIRAGSTTRGAAHEHPQRAGRAR